MKKRYIVIYREEFMAEVFAKDEKEAMDIFLSGDAKYELYGNLWPEYIEVIPDDEKVANLVWKSTPEDMKQRAKDRGTVCGLVKSGLSKELATKKTSAVYRKLSDLSNDEKILSLTAKESMKKRYNVNKVSGRG